MIFTKLFISQSRRNLIFLQARNINCWSCGKDTTLVANLFCSNCNSLQKPNPKENYFKLMGVNESYDLDEKDLSNRYKQLQRFLHPDKYANRDKMEQEISAKYSSLINEAYKTLLEPLDRGVYMLKLRGKQIEENTETDPTFLMEIMEKNEEVQNAETEAEIMKLNMEINMRIQDLQKKLSTAFFDGDMKRVMKLLGHMKYYTSIYNQIQNSIRNKGMIQ